jgi:hypothetical protein
MSRDILFGKGEELREGLRPSLLYSPLQPNVFFSNIRLQAGEGLGVRQLFQPNVNKANNIGSRQ